MRIAERGTMQGQKKFTINLLYWKNLITSNKNADILFYFNY